MNKLFEEIFPKPDFLTYSKYWEFYTFSESLELTDELWLDYDSYNDKFEGFKAFYYNK